MTATISLFIYVSQQDIILKEMVWFEIYTDLLIMSVLVTFHFEEITLFIEWYFQLCQKIRISVFAYSSVYFYTSPEGMSLWQIRYIWLPR